MAASTCNFEAGGGTCQGTIVVLFRERRDPYGLLTQPEGIRTPRGRRKERGRAGALINTDMSGGLARV